MMFPLSDKLKLQTLLGIVVFILFPSFYLLSNILLQIDIGYFSNIFESPIEIKNIIRDFAAQGLILFFSLIIILYLSIIYKLNKEKKIRNIIIYILVFLLLGTVGSILKVGNKYEVHQLEGRIQLLKDSDVKMAVNFLDFDPELVGFLEKAERGEVRAFIMPFLSSNEGQKLPVKLQINNIAVATYDKEKTSLSPEIVESMRATKKLELAFSLPEKKYLYVRDLGRNCKNSRNDLLFLNGVNTTIPFDGCFITYLMFESLDGKPLRVFF